MQLSPIEDVSTILEMAGLRTINVKSSGDGSDRHILACTHSDCLHALTIGTTLLHHIAKHKVPLTRPQQKEIGDWLVTDPPLTRSEDIATPQPGMPPIHGLKVHHGLACLLCTYCALTDRSMEQHILEEHTGAYDRTAKKSSRHRSASLQTFFIQRPRYFEVNPVLEGCASTDLYSIYVNNLAKTIESSVLVVPPSGENEIPPLLRITCWHEHLADFITDRPKIQELRKLMTLPTSKSGLQWLGDRLSAVINTYMVKIRKMANAGGIGVKCLLMECPR